MFEALWGSLWGLLTSAVFAWFATAGAVALALAGAVAARIFLGAPFKVVLLIAALGPAFLGLNIVHEHGRNLGVQQERVLWQKRPPKVVVKTVTKTVIKKVPKVIYKEKKVYLKAPVAKPRPQREQPQRKPGFLKRLLGEDREQGQEIYDRVNRLGETR